MLLACLVCLAPVVRGAGGSALLGGVFAGVACTVKIWWFVPVVVLGVLDRAGHPPSVR